MKSSKENKKNLCFDYLPVTEYIHLKIKAI